MYKRIVLLTSLLCISLHAVTAQNGFDLARIKDNYKTNIAYATYIGATSLLCHFLCYAYSTNQLARHLLTSTTTASCTWGALNALKWLFVHLYPQCTQADIDFLEKTENLCLVLLLLKTEQRYIQYTHRQNLLAKFK